MKRLFTTLLVCGFLAGSLAQAAKPGSHAKAKQHKAAQKARKARKKGRKAGRKARLHGAAN